MHHRISIILLIGFLFFNMSCDRVSISYKNIRTNESNSNIPKEDIVELDEKLGQNIIVGIPGKNLDQASLSMLKSIKPAGIILYQRNFESYEQIEKLIDKLQSINIKESRYPYFIMLDEEPDGANRMGLLKNILTLGNPNWFKIESDIKKLSSIGINVELAPLADYPFLPNSFISKRIPFKTKEDMIAFNKTFIHLLNKNNIISTLKHFPGLGLISDDPHYKIIEDDSETDIIDQSINIFQSGIQNGASFVMTSHVIYDRLDPDYPTTFSKKIVSDILINKLGFKGIIVTDDLSDMPLSMKNLELIDAGIDSLRAGHHLIMFSHNLPKTYKIYEEMLNKIKKDKELQALIEANYEKIISFKDQFFK